MHGLCIYFHLKFLTKEHLYWIQIQMRLDSIEVSGRYNNRNNTSTKKVKFVLSDKIK